MIGVANGELVVTRQRGIARREQFADENILWSANSISIL